MPQKRFRVRYAAAAVLLLVTACPGKTPNEPEPSPHPYLTGRAIVSWAANDAGQLGNGGTQQQLVPISVPGLDNIRAIAAGGNRSLALLTDGTVWQWGAGQTSPARVAGLANVIAIAAGERHALALTSARQVYAWGQNESGQLGDDSTDTHATPVLVNGLSNVATIAAGRAHNVAIRSDLTVATWGANSKGQLGDGTTTDRLVPVDVPGLKAIEVATAYDHTLAVSSNVRVVGWGDNHACQLGSPTFDPPVCKDSATPVDLGGNVSASGRAIGASATATLIRTSERRIEMLGKIDDGPQSPSCVFEPVYWARRDVVGAPESSALVSGARHSFLIASDGRVFGLGANNAGQLGAGTVAPRSCLTEATTIRGVAALAAGGAHSLAVVTGIPQVQPPSPIPFPSTAVGATSAVTVTLRNIGLAPLAVYRVAAEGDFDTSQNCPPAPAAVAPGGTCGLTVTFKPSAAGPRSGALLVTHDGNGRTLRIELKATATEPKLVFAPALVDFGGQRVGTTSQPARTVTIRNDGDADLVINQIQATAGFAITTTTCPTAPQAVAAGGGSCTVDIVFAPLEARTAVGELTVTHTGAKTASMTLRGMGVAPAGTAAPANVVFPGTTVGAVSAPVTITITNAGPLPLVLGTPATAGDFQIAATTCTGATLPSQGATCTVAVQFAPAAAGNRTGTLTVPNDGLPAVLTVPLEGTGS